MIALLILLGTYLACGLVFAIPFLLVGVKRIDPHAAHGSWGFRLLIFPGTIFLWPLLAKRWFSGTGAPPEEKNAHRSTARSAGLRPAAILSGGRDASQSNELTMVPALRLTEPRSGQQLA